jgi:acyl-CoA synthetase (AMP-forming)/AMP-acid ligase II
MKSLCELLPHTRLFNTYASTETGIIATYNYNDGRCQAGCMGHPMKHAGVRIDSDGRIVCRGRTLMTGYAYDFDMTSQILRDGELYTADLGQIDENGMLHLVGRMDDVINVGGFKVDPVEVENVAMELPQVADCICVQVEHPVAGMALKLIVVMRDGENMDRKTIARFISQKLESYKVPLIYEQADHICRTFNGKPDRKFYRV